MEQYYNNSNPHVFRISQSLYRFNNLHICVFTGANNGLVALAKNEPLVLQAPRQAYKSALLASIDSGSCNNLLRIRACWYMERLNIKDQAEKGGKEKSTTIVNRGQDGAHSIVAEV